MRHSCLTTVDEQKGCDITLVLVGKFIHKYCRRKTRKKELCSISRVVFPKPSRPSKAKTCEKEKIIIPKIEYRGKKSQVKVTRLGDINVHPTKFRKDIKNCNMQTPGRTKKKKSLFLSQQYLGKK